MNISLGLHPFPWELLFCSRDPPFFHFFATPIAHSRPQASPRQTLSHFLSPEFTNPLMARPTTNSKIPPNRSKRPPVFSILCDPYRTFAPQGEFQTTPNAFQRPPNCKPPNGAPERMPQKNVVSRPQTAKPPMARPSACHKIM